MSQTVSVRAELVEIPTYQIGRPEKNPMFLEKRVYQGSSGVVYPHPVIEKIYDEKVNKIYNAVIIENNYIKVMILPELGGRIQMAYDKIKERHFIYYNNVIKPALVGLTGPWISGGIEFNWPQHHRPSTFEPVDYTIEAHADGSKTVWVNEVERMFRTKGMAGFTLYPDKSYIEIKGKLYNRTPFPQTFLWWANPAVKVNDHYQSVFPPDVYAVFDHGKRDVSSFPIAKGVYYKVDYAPGTDISRYKNIPVPTSYMAIASKYDFMGGYEHDSKGGLLHVADHHVSPGKKQWTWGNGAFGQAWDRNLTDEDGPYIELMTGMFTDNQPDFSWLQPFEEKTFTQYFMPYQELGMVKNATKDAAVNIEFEKEAAHIKVYFSSVIPEARIILLHKGQYIFSETMAGSPEKIYAVTVPLPADASPLDIQLKVTSGASGKTVVSYEEEEKRTPEIPQPAQAAKKPEDIENNEQLYLTGLHLEQYRHATFQATDYYKEALRRDSKDARCNNAMGLWLLRRGQFGQAEPYFRTAVATLIQRNPNPYDGEAYYNLGWCLLMQQKETEAYDAFYKSVWNHAWQHAGYLNLARIATGRQDMEKALELVEKSLIRNYHSHTARHLKTVILRKLHRKQEAQEWIQASLVIDPFNYGCLYEEVVLLQAAQKPEEAAVAQAQLLLKSRDWVHNFIEYAFDYAHAGLYAEASAFLQLHGGTATALYPMVYYYLGWFAYRQGQMAEGAAYYAQAMAANPDFCFPNRVEDVVVLSHAIHTNSTDAKALYYLGNFWYDKRQYTEAIECWERSVQADSQFPTVHRNLSLAYYNRLQQPEKARASLEKAFALDTTDARILMELDQLYKKVNVPVQERLDLLEEYAPLVAQRDDLCLERITLYNQLGRYEEAKELLSIMNFHPWEGGEGKVTGQYLICHLQLAKKALEQEKPQDALQLLEAAENYPDNLGEGKLYGTQENDIYYLKGLAYEQLGNAQEAKTWFEQATIGISEPVQAIFYNDPQPDKIFYQGLAWNKLSNTAKAKEIFGKLISFGTQHSNDHIAIDYFAVSLPDLLVFDADLDLRNRIHCAYLRALGYLGLGNGHTEEAADLFAEVLTLDVNHQGAMVHQQMIQSILV